MRQVHWHPPTDIYETESAFKIRLEIAGMDEDQFNIVFEQNTLSIFGYRTDEIEKESRRSFHQMEIHFGEFLVQIPVNHPIEHEKITAEFNNGFLKVTLPKAFPRRINIRED